jgi:hypothetical protein
VAISLWFGKQSLLLAADSAQGNDGTAMGQPVEVATGASGDAANAPVKVNKSRKKEPPPEPEPLPGQKLTIKQVMNILKTTRNLSGRNLSGLKLIGVDLSRCNLKGVDLSHANLERADLGESNLERAELAGANLKMVNLRLTGMVGTNLDRAILDGAVWKDGRVCSPGSVGLCK